MIELDVISYLNNDATLSGLLGVTISDTKIYPIQAPQGAETPYIIYNTPSEGTPEENNLELTISLDCIAEDFVDAKGIKDRLIALLDRQDKIRDLISSVDYYIYWAKMTGANSFKDPDLGYFHRVAIVDFQFAKK